MAGSGGVIVMDETTCMVDALYSAVRFFAHESAGSVPLAVREPAGFIASCAGLPKGKDGCRTWRTCSPSPATWKEDDLRFRGRGRLADPVLHTKFRDEFETYIREGRKARSMEAVPCPS